MERKARLWAAGLCRTVTWIGPQGRMAMNLIRTAEKQADGLILLRELEDACYVDEWSDLWPERMLSGLCFHFAWCRPDWDPACVRVLQALIESDGMKDEPRELLHDLFPLRWPGYDLDINVPVPHDAVGLAKAAYHGTGDGGRADPDRLAVLSDCLEEHGYRCHEVVEHLRSPGPHVKGCWGLDVVLGLEGKKKRLVRA